MEEIEVGEYVRTIYGEITRLKEGHTANGLYYYPETKIFDGQEKCNHISNRIIAKHSKNLIDLIEVGDVLKINDEKYEVIYDESYEKLGILVPNRKQLAIRHSALEFIFNQHKDISIVTKEQFASMEYKIQN